LPDRDLAFFITEGEKKLTAFIAVKNFVILDLIYLFQQLKIPYTSADHILIPNLGPSSIDFTTRDS